MNLAFQILVAMYVYIKRPAAGKGDMSLDNGIRSPTY